MHIPATLLTQLLAQLLLANVATAQNDRYDWGPALTKNCSEWNCYIVGAPANPCCFGNGACFDQNFGVEGGNPEVNCPRSDNCPDTVVERCDADCCDPCTGWGMPCPK